MTLLYLDGFAHAQSASRYVGGSGPGMTLTAAPRVAGGYYANSNQNVEFKKAITASADVIVGMGFRPNSTTANQGICSFWGDSNATQHITVRRNVSTGFIEVTRAGTLIATGTTLCPANAWFYIEVRVTISDTVGVVQVRLNGSTVNDINFSGDTRNAGTSTNIDTIGFGNWANGSADFIADVYILNSLGTLNNTFLGDVAVRVLTPNGDGSSSVLVGSDGNSVSNWQQVDELPPAAADYNGSANAGDKDTYALSDLAANVTTVFGVQVDAVMAKSDAGTGSAKIVTRSGGTDFVPNTYGLQTSYVEYRELQETDPATSAAWTVAAANALQVGMQVA